MKISEMLEREDLYPIIEHTLNNYFGFKEHQILKTQKNRKGTKFGYIYERLNAIVSRKPDKKVMEFLYTEYQTKQFFKRILAQVYLRVLLHSSGLFADKVLKNNDDTELDNHILIYPCNKKIRIFNFNDNYIDVVVKDGFSNDLIAKEIKFREQHLSLHILPITSKTQNSYREQIIDGIPLARIINAKKYKELKNKTLKILKSEISTYKKNVDTKAYVEQLKTEFYKKINGAGLEELKETYETLSQIVLDNFEQIPVVLSHGDFHHGNVWIENKTDIVYIIDFETYSERSMFYDPYTLFHDLRTFDFHSTMIKLLKGGGSEVFGNQYIGGILALILMEDFLFQTNDLAIFDNDSMQKEIISYNFKVTKVIEKIKGND